MHILFTWETPLVNPWPPVHILHCLQTHLLAFHHHYSTGHFSLFHLLHHIINRFVFCETEKIDNLSAVGGKVFGWVCAGPRLLKVKCQRSSTFTSFFISKSYWFDKPRFFNWGKTATIYNSAFSWGTTQLRQLCQHLSHIASQSSKITRNGGSSGSKSRRTPMATS